VAELTVDQFHYLILLGLCLLITLPLELVLRCRVYRRPLRLLLSLLPVLVIFIGWDLLGIARGHWSYSERFVTGVRIGVLPLEEIAFFVVIPICGLLAYEAVGRSLELMGRSRHPAPAPRNPGTDPSSRNPGRGDA
jgi:lycopene beta-cyclase